MPDTIFTLDAAGAAVLAEVAPVFGTTTPAATFRKILGLARIAGQYGRPDGTLVIGTSTGSLASVLLREPPAPEPVPPPARSRFTVIQGGKR